MDPYEITSGSAMSALGLADSDNTDAATTALSQLSTDGRDDTSLQFHLSLTVDDDSAEVFSLYSREDGEMDFLKFVELIRDLFHVRDLVDPFTTIGPGLVRDVALSLARKAPITTKSQVAETLSMMSFMGLVRKWNVIVEHIVSPTDPDYQLNIASAIQNLPCPSKLWVKNTLEAVLKLRALPELPAGSVWEAVFTEVAKLYALGVDTNVGLPMLEQLQFLVFDVIQVQFAVELPRVRTTMIAKILQQVYNDISTMTDGRTLIPPTFINFLRCWQQVVTRDVVVCITDGHILKHPCTLLHELRPLREKVIAKRSRWIFSDSAPPGLEVPHDIIVGSKTQQHRFVDHGDGSGIVYHWPPQLAAGYCYRPVKLQQNFAPTSTTNTNTTNAPGTTTTVAANNQVDDVDISIDDSFVIDAWDIITAKVARHDRAVVECGGGGNCFFHSVSSGTSHDHATIRQMVVALMRTRIEEYRQRLDYTEVTDDATGLLRRISWHDYINLLSHVGFYVHNQEEIQATADVLNLEIRCWEVNAERPIVIATVKDINDLHRIEIARASNHYRAVRVKRPGRT
eukprot:m.123876 g.123876  ORF g.123876 m.123876 type:complete len:569 (-) comp29019_c0_seq1:253-1959(-)